MTERRHDSPLPPTGGFGAHDAPPAGAGSAFHPPPPPLKGPQTKGMSGWLIALIAVSVVVLFVLGPLVVLAVSGVRRFITQSKVAEARNSLGMIARDATAAYEAEVPELGTVSKRQLCGSATAPVPVGLALVSGKKYVSLPNDWEQDKEANTGFSCLKFRMVYPQYYQYDYKSDGKRFTAFARGDLDGNGTFSEFKFGGQVIDGTVVPDTRMEETDPTE